MTAKTFSVIEYFSFFALRHNPTGEEHSMGDGVDSVYDDEGEPISPGAPGFIERWEADLNADADTILKAYFPHLVED